MKLLKILPICFLPFLLNGITLAGVGLVAVSGLQARPTAVGPLNIPSIAGIPGLPLPDVAQSIAGSWHIETVDTVGDVGATSSLALDGASRAHISYYDRGNGDLKYVRQTATGWQIETVDSMGNVGEWSSLVLDSMGRPHISYHDYTYNDLKHAWYDGNIWHIETADSTVEAGMGTSLALDKDGNPHIVYCSLYRLKYAWYDGTQWHIETISNLSYARPSLVLDETDRPHVAYNETNDGLTYAWRDGAVWHAEAVEDTFINIGVSLALDGLGQPHIAYIGNSTQNLKYAWRDGIAWQTETVDWSILYDDPSLALDSAGHPRLSYGISPNNELRYAWHDGTTWHITEIDTSIGPNIGPGPSSSLALDGWAQPHISYYDSTNDNLKYAQYVLPPPIMNKQATPSDGLCDGDVLTYTLTISASGLSVRLWDPLPVGISYITDSITSTITPVAIYSDSARAVIWEGILPTDTVQVIRFQVMPVVTATGIISLSPPIVNTAWLTPTGSSRSVSATVIVNGRRTYLPLALRQYP